MPGPTERIRDRIAQAAPSERRAIRAAEVGAAVADIVAGQRIVRPGMAIEFQRPPRFIMYRGVPAGVDALVRVFDGAVERHVDPHRRIINPPTLVPDGAGVREDALEAFLQALEQSLDTVPAAHRWGTVGTVTTVYATAPGGAGSVQSYAVGDYPAARTGTGALGATGEHKLGQDSVVFFSCFESFLIFDTSVLGDTEAVSDVVLSLDGDVDSSTTDFDAVAASSSYNGGAVVTTDFVSGASLSGLTTYATWNSSGYSAGYNAFTSAGAAFNSAINLTGNTAMIVYSARHRDGTSPPNTEQVNFRDADAAGTTIDPKLDITHATPQFIRPVSTSAAGNWTAQPSGTLHANTADDSDTTYADLNQGDDPSTMILTLDTVAQPTVEGTGTIRIRRART